jgi:hypothetical protein
MLFTSPQRLQGLGYLGVMVISTAASGVAIRSITFGIPVADAALYLVEKVEGAHIRQVSEVAN